MNTLPYLDTEEKLRDYTKQHWNIDIEPALISAYCGISGDVLIFPSDAYKMQFSQLNSAYKMQFSQLNSACHGRITVDLARRVHPCVLPVLREAYRKKEQEEEELILKRVQEQHEYLRAIELKKDEMQARVRKQHNSKLLQEIEEMKKAPSTKQKLEAMCKEDETIKQVRADIHQRGLALLKAAMNEPYHEKKQCEAAPPKGWLALLLQKWKQS